MQNVKCRMQNELCVEVIGKEAEVRFGKRTKRVRLDKIPLLWAISKVALKRRAIQSISVNMREATFSGVRQVIATVNALAWGLGIKVNDKRQMSAKYSGEPNITL